MKASVLIPAYNEEALIGGVLDSLTSGLEPGEVEVFVLCNGCRDRTAAIAREFEDRGVRVIEIERASKTNALNVGDSEAAVFPRIYLDGDVQLSSRSLRLLVERLSMGDVPAAEPRPRFETGASSLAVRIYYSVWQALHGQEPGRVGSGVVALSAGGRERFGEFPEIIADDAYLRRQFARGELVHAPGATSFVQAPRDLSSLVKIKTRSRRGSVELERLFPSMELDGPGLLQRLGRVPVRLWLLVPAYLFITLWIRRSSRQALAARFEGWERDESSRSR